MLQDLLARRTVLCDLVPELLREQYERQQLLANLNKVVRVLVVLGKSLSSTHFVGVLSKIQLHFSKYWSRRLILASPVFTPALAKALQTDLQHLTELFEARQETGEVKGIPRAAQAGMQGVYELLPLLTISAEGLKDIFSQEPMREVVGWLLLARGETTFLKSQLS